jgi:hypothetical protein
LLDRSVARSGFSYDGYVRQHAGNGNCRQTVQASLCLIDFKKLKNTKIAEISERFTMDMKPIRTAKDHKDALAEISKLMSSDQGIGTPKGERLDVLVTLVQAY